MDPKPDRSRETIKNVLACIDERDWKAASDGIAVLDSDASVDHPTRLFLRSVVFLFRGDVRDAESNLMQFIDLLTSDVGKEEADLPKLISFVSSLLLMCASSSKGKLAGQPLEPAPELRDSVGLNEHEKYPDSGFTILKGIVLKIYAHQFLLKTKTSGKAAEFLKSLYMFQMLPNLKPSLAVFEQFYRRDSIYRFMVELITTIPFFEFVIEKYFAVWEETWFALSLLQKREYINMLAEFVKRVEPGVDTEVVNGKVYIEAKRKLNLLFFSLTVEENNLAGAFEWIEKEHGGMDFLRIKEFPTEYANRPSTENALLDLLQPRYRKGFALQEKFFPYDYKLEDWLYLHEVVLGNPEEYLDFQRKYLWYYCSNYIYSDYLLNKRLSDTDDVRRTIESRILENTKSIEEQAGEDENIKRVIIPVNVPQILEKLKRFDDAIECYKKSNFAEEKINEAIERCKHRRDGFIYDELKETLRSLDEQEQRQLIAYAALFKTEIRLRGFIDDTITAKHGNTTWWDFYVKDEKIKSECRVRQEEFEKNIYYREAIIRPRLLDFTSFTDLERIIDVNWDLFGRCFKDKKQFGAMLAFVSRVRNDVAHARIVDNGQLKKLQDDCLQINKMIDRFKESTK